MADVDEELLILEPAPRMRVALLANAALLLLLAALLGTLGLDYAARLNSADDPLLPADSDLLRQAVTAVIWATIGLCALVALWCLWAAAPWGSRPRLRLGRWHLDLVPFAGLTRSLRLEDLRGVDEVPGRVIRRQHLAVESLGRRRPLRIYRWWFDADAFVRLRERLVRQVEQQEEAGVPAAS